MWLTRLALRNPFSFLMLSLMLIVLGVVSLNRLSVDLFPDITIPVIRIATFYTGAGRKTSRSRLPSPSSARSSASPGVDKVESSSKQGVSLISVWFAYGPTSTTPSSRCPSASPRSSTPCHLASSSLCHQVRHHQHPSRLGHCRERPTRREQLYDLAYNTIEPQLERVPGVASATVGGARSARSKSWPTAMPCGRAAWISWL